MTSETGRVGSSCSGNIRVDVNSPSRSETSRVNTSRSSRSGIICIVKHLHIMFLITCIVYLIWTLSIQGTLSVHGGNKNYRKTSHRLNWNENSLDSDKGNQTTNSFQNTLNHHYSHDQQDNTQDNAQTASTLSRIRHRNHKRRKDRQKGSRQTFGGRHSRKGKNQKKKPKKIKTQVGLWSEWGECSIPCGVGQQERSRSCGLNCKEVESKPCLSTSCPDSSSDKWTEKWEYYEIFKKEEENIANRSNVRASDACEKWMQCSNKSIQHYLTKIAYLPSCPCSYPLTVGQDRQLWDRAQEKNFVWEDASSSEEKLDIYKPGAKYCIRSKLTSYALASQQCCYDNYHRLITRGRDAGTPNLVSPQLSRELHRKVDVLPWVMCKGDWTRYNMVIHPNNKRQCTENPDLSEIKYQILLAKNY